MPGDSLSLSVRVGCKENRSSTFGFLLKLLDKITLTADVDIMRLKSVFNINTESALGEIANVTL